MLFSGEFQIFTVCQDAPLESEIKNNVLKNGYSMGSLNSISVDVSSPANFSCSPKSPQ